jgi:mannose-6-phosphate isomerase-like protein (cupin superfamily)
VFGEVITDRPDLLIRRMVLQPGEATPWHVDRCHRFTVVVQGEQITIEFRDSPKTVDVPVKPGETGWDGPDHAVHRAVNTGSTPFEEVVTFCRAAPDEDPQPVC